MITDKDIKKWKPLVCKIAHRYRNNPYKIELEDLQQVGYIGLIKGLKSFREDKGNTLTTHLFNSVEWEIRRELSHYKRLKRKINNDIASLDILVGEEKETTLAELIEDPYANVENEVSEKLIMDRYVYEIKKTLQDPIDIKFALLLLIDDVSIFDISNMLNIDIEEARKRRKSIKEKLARNMFIRLRYREYKNILAINMYNSINYYDEPDRTTMLKYDAEQKLIKLL